MNQEANTQEMSMDEAAQALEQVQEKKKAGRKPRADKAPKEVDPRAEKYPALKGTFLRGSFGGQLNSAYKDREQNPEKAAQYVQALHAGDLSLPADNMVTRAEADKLKALGMEVPEDMIKAGGRGLGGGEGKAKAGHPDYPALKGSFLRGKFKGQVASAAKDQEANPEKAADYIRALKAGVCAAPENNQVTRHEAKLLEALGYADHPYEVQAPAPKPERAPKLDENGNPVPRKSARRKSGKSAVIEE